MPIEVVNEINKSKSYSYDDKTKRVVNLKPFSKSDIDEFLAIQHLLDGRHIPYRFEKDFHIQILNT